MKCPICQKEMVRDWEKNIEVDVCLDHGVWLDKGELERIVTRTKGSNNSSSRQAELDKAYDQGKWEGVCWDIWSLFFKRK